jgi:Tetratricopeptide repeat.
MAMFTKEIAITLPLMILLYDYCFLRTEDKGRVDWKYAAPLLATIFIIPLTMFLTRSVDFIGMHRIAGTTPNISPWHYLLTQFNVVVTYVRLLFIPVNQNFDYDYHISRSLLELPALSGLILLALILAAAIKLFSKYRLASFGIFWFFLTLLPESSIIPIRDVIYEHRLYLPMVGFSLFLASAVCYIFENKNFKSMIAVLLIIASYYGIFSYVRNGVWKDELTLWSDTVRKSPNKARPYNNRAVAYGKKGNLPQALSDLNRALEIDPRLAEAYVNRGNAYYIQNDFDRAISDSTRAIEIRPDYAEAYYNRAVAYGQQSNVVQAISDFTRALGIRPDHAGAYYNRAVAHFFNKEYDSAWSDVHKARDLGFPIDRNFLDDLKKSSGRDN